MLYNTANAYIEALKCIVRMYMLCSIVPCCTPLKSILGNIELLAQQLLQLLLCLAVGLWHTLLPLPFVCTYSRAAHPYDRHGGSTVRVSPEVKCKQPQNTGVEVSLGVEYYSMNLGHLQSIMGGGAIIMTAPYGMHTYTYVHGIRRKRGNRSNSSLLASIQLDGLHTNCIYFH